VVELLFEFASYLELLLPRNVVELDMHNSLLVQQYVALSRCQVVKRYSIWNL
jgi:hypothetical protein